MNINTLNKYWKELEHFKNGGSLQARIWVSDPNDDDTSYTIWYKVGDTNWDIDKVFNYDLEYSKVQIIINDEYLEFRKALAEGKIIQQQDYYSKEWIDMKTDKFHGASDTQYEGIYRIKPEEPKFKVGDWVIVKNRIGFVYTVCKDTGKICIHGSPDITNWYNYSDLQLWQPQLGELVILNKNGMISIIKYNGETNVYPFIGEITW